MESHGAMAYLGDRVDSLADAHRDRQQLLLLVQSEQHAGPHGRRQAVEQVWGLAADGGLHF